MFTFLFTLTLIQSFKRPTPKSIKKKNGIIFSFIYSVSYPGSSLHCRGRQSKCNCFGFKSCVRKRTKSTQSELRTKTIECRCQPNGNFTKANTGRYSKEQSQRKAAGKWQTSFPGAFFLESTRPALNFIG